MIRLDVGELDILFIGCTALKIRHCCTFIKVFTLTLE